MLPKSGNMVHPQQMIEQMEENKFGLQQLVNRFKRVSLCCHMLTCYQIVITVKRAIYCYLVFLIVT